MAANSSFLSETVSGFDAKPRSGFVVELLRRNVKDLTLANAKSDFAAIAGSGEIRSRERLAEGVGQVHVSIGRRGLVGKAGRASTGRITT